MKYFNLIKYNILIIFSLEMSTQSIGSCKCFDFIKFSRLFCWHVLTRTKYPFFHIGMNLDNKVTFYKATW